MEALKRQQQSLQTLEVTSVLRMLGVALLRARRIVTQSPFVGMADLLWVREFLTQLNAFPSETLADAWATSVPLLRKRALEDSVCPAAAPLRGLLAMLVPSAMVWDSPLLSLSGVLKPMTVCPASLKVLPQKPLAEAALAAQRHYVMLGCFMLHVRGSSSSSKRRPPRYLQRDVAAIHIQPSPTTGSAGVYLRFAAPGAASSASNASSRHFLALGLFDLATSKFFRYQHLPPLPSSLRFEAYRSSGPEAAAGKASCFRGQVLSYPVFCRALRVITRGMRKLQRRWSTCPVRFNLLQKTDLPHVGMPCMYCGAVLVQDVQAGTSRSTTDGVPDQEAASPAAVHSTLNHKKRKASAVAAATVSPAFLSPLPRAPAAATRSNAHKPAGHVPASQHKCPDSLLFDSECHEALLSAVPPMWREKHLQGTSRAAELTLQQRTAIVQPLLERLYEFWCRGPCIREPRAALELHAPRVLPGFITGTLHGAKVTAVSGPCAPAAIDQWVVPKSAVERIPKDVAANHRTVRCFAARTNANFYRYRRGMVLYRKDLAACLFSCALQTPADAAPQASRPSSQPQAACRPPATSRPQAVPARDVLSTAWVRQQVSVIPSALAQQDQQEWWMWPAASSDDTQLQEPQAAHQGLHHGGSPTSSIETPDVNKRQRVCIPDDTTQQQQQQPITVQTAGPCR
jgi:hypothetical protein